MSSSIPNQSENAPSTVADDPLNEGSVKVTPSSIVDVRPRDWDLIAIALGPIVWTGHFLASYLTNAIYCAKFAEPSRDAQPVQMWILIYTCVALPMIGAIGASHYFRHRLGRKDVPHDGDSSADRFRFLGYAGFLLALLSGVAVLFTAMVAIFIGSCD